MNIKSATLCAMCGFAALLAIGCQEEPDSGIPAVMKGEEAHAGHAHAETLVEAVEEMVGMRNVIRDGFAKDDADAAHGPLHEVGHVLGEVEELAEKEELEVAQLNSVRDAVEELKEAFGSVDKMMHGGEGSEYSEVADKVDAAIAVLVKVSGANPEGAAHEGHDDHEGHEEHEGHDEDHAEGHEDHDKHGDEEHKDGDHDKK